MQALAIARETGDKPGEKRIQKTLDMMAQENAGPPAPNEAN